MSLYNLVVGVDPLAKLVFGVLGLDPREVPRLRDAYVDVGGQEPVLVVFTRTGGGNRPDYEVENEQLRQHPCFLEDMDDAYDSTFAHFKYRVPESHAELVKAAVELGRQEGYAFPSPMERFQRALERVKMGESSMEAENAHSDEHEKEGSHEG